MSSDEILLYSSYLAFLISIILAYKFSKKFAGINFVVFLLYTSCLMYGLYYKSQGGAGLVWGFFLLLFTGIHFLFILTYLISKWFKMPQPSVLRKKYILSFFSSIGLLLIGVLLKIYHWPFGNLIFYSGIGLSCLVMLVYVVKKYKRK